MEGNDMIIRGAAGACAVLVLASLAAACGGAADDRTEPAGSPAPTDRSHTASAPATRSRTSASATPQSHPRTTPRVERRAAPHGVCHALVLPFGDAVTRPVDRIVTTEVRPGVRAGLRTLPPDGKGGPAGPTVTLLPAGTTVTVCGKYVRSDGMVTWKGVVTKSGRTGWVLSVKLVKRK
jgi:hypothetical protein